MVKEPIKYVEQEQNQKDSILVEVQQHYSNLKANLIALAEIPINVSAGMPQLQQAATFQQQIPEYLQLCKKYMRMTTKARKTLADRLEKDYSCQGDTTSSTDPEGFDPNSALMRTINARQQMHPHHLSLIHI